ncbi:MAG TPA: COX15/CtaA family protein [Chloroflexota bacterium]|nr:COX15/CtaA family protein [Chloroflexota bacterium]
MIVAGATVRVTGSGLGCPDWPTCHGQLLPPLEFTAIVEYTHRLLGAMTSAFILAVPFSGLMSRRERRFLIPALALPALLALQIALGALVVRLELDPLAVLIHLGFALLILGGMVWLTVLEAPGIADRRPAGAPPALLRWLAGLAVMTFALILAGGVTRASGASWACRSFPGCNAPVEALAATGDPQLLVAIHHTHRGLAYLVAVGAVWAAVAVWRQRAGTVRTAALALVGAVIIQITLGALAVNLGLPAALRGAHVAGAAAVWAAAVTLVSLEARGT